MRPAGSFTIYLPSLPFDFFHWWFFESTVNLAKILAFIFRAAVHLLSIDLIFRTFFKPWKNEYRQGLERFSIFFGAGFKSFLLVFDVFFLIGLVIVEIGVFLVWVSLPLLFLWGIYAGLFL
jgi:hypothetical protein